MAANPHPTPIPAAAPVLRPEFDVSVAVGEDAAAVDDDDDDDDDEGDDGDDFVVDVDEAVVAIVVVSKRARLKGTVSPSVASG
jgi:hypothetical protein